MNKYVKPTYEKETVEVQDVILASLTVEFVGNGTLGKISGVKAAVSMAFDKLLGD